MANFLQNFFIVLGQVGTLFLMMAVGYLLAKLGKLTPAALPQLSYILLYVATPCILLDMLQSECDPGILGDLSVAFLLILAAFAAYSLLARLVFRRGSRDTVDTLCFSSIFGNTGFMGFPLMIAILGRENLIFSVPVFLAFHLYVWTYGVCLMGGKAQLSFKKLFLNSSMLSLVVGLPMFFFGIRLPAPVGAAVGYLADLNTPLAMIFIGAQMAAIDIPATFRNKQLYAGAALRLLVAPLVTFLLIMPFHLSPALFVTVMVLSATPTAGIAGMFAEQFDRDRKSAAQSLTLSTILSIITLPLVAVIAQRIAGI